MTPARACVCAVNMSRQNRSCSTRLTGYPLRGDLPLRPTPLAVMWPCARARGTRIHTFTRARAHTHQHPPADADSPSRALFSVAICLPRSPPCYSHGAPRGARPLAPPCSRCTWPMQTCTVKTVGRERRGRIVVRVEEGAQGKRIAVAIRAVVCSRCRHGRRGCHGGRESFIF